MAIDARALLLTAAGLAAGCGGDGSVAVDAAADADIAPDAAPDAGPAAPMRVYVGGGDNQIHRFRMDPVTLALTFEDATPTGAGPSFLAFDPAGRWLVAVNEGADAVESFAIGPTGALTAGNRRGAGGRGPAHVAIDPAGPWVIVANYGDGSVTTLPIGADGAIGLAADTVAAGANAHQVVVDGARGVSYVPCLGVDAIRTYRVDSGGGLVSAGSASADAGSGPRHLALHPSLDLAYVLNERASTVRTYQVAATSALTGGPTVSSLPPGFGGPNTGAEIAVHPGGRWLYASNRGHDSLAVAALGSDGAVGAVSHVGTAGTRPRHFSIVPGGRAILVANQGSGTIIGFHVDPVTGALISAGELAQVPSPAFVAAVAAP